MSYIGNEPTSVAFLTDTFSGNGSTTAFTMSVAPATTTSILVAITGVVQDPSTYSVVGTTLTFSAAPPSGTGNISVRYLGIPASGVTTTAYRTVTEFTATAGQTTFSVPSYTVGYIDVYRNGVLLGSADYTASNGTTVVLTAGATAGDLVTTESFYVSSVLNALPQTGGTLSGNLIVTGTETVSTITSPSATSLSIQSSGTTALTIDTSQNVGIGTSSPSQRLTVSGGDVGISNGTLNIARTSYPVLEMNQSGSTGVGQFAMNGNNLEIRQTQAFDTLFYTNNAERMRIDASGRVTMPYQPSFHATHSNGSLSTGEIVWGNVVYNIGSYYNASNGRFTAPVSGTYYFCAHTLIQNAPAGEVRMAIYKNGSNYGGLRFITIKPANSWWSIIAEGHVYMTAGDYVSIFMEHNPTTLYNDANYNSFSGNFIG